MQIDERAYGRLIGELALLRKLVLDLADEILGDDFNHEGWARLVRILEDGGYDDTAVHERLRERTDAAR